MVELKSLQLQLENLQILLDDAMLKGFSVETVKMLSSQIKEVENAIADRKKKLEN